MGKRLEQGFTYILSHRPRSTTGLCFAKSRMVSQNSFVHEPMAFSDTRTLDIEEALLTMRRTVDGTRGSRIRGHAPCFDLERHLLER